MNKGFSLVELLVVVAIIGVLAAVGAVGYDQYVEASKMRVFKQNVNTVIKAVDFEYTVISNDLISAIKEIDKDGNMIDEDGNITTNASNQRVISADSTCEGFVWSVKEHFKDFKNPWMPDKKMITVDTEGQGQHKQGMLQVVCHRGGSGFVSGWNCKIQDSLFHMIAYYYDGIANDGSLRTDVNTLRGGNATSNSTGIMVSEWFNRGYIDPPVDDRINATMPYMTSAAGEELCGSDGFNISSISVASDADY